MGSRASRFKVKECHNYRVRAAERQQNAVAGVEAKKKTSYQTAEDIFCQRLHETCVQETAPVAEFHF